MRFLLHPLSLHRSPLLSLRPRRRLPRLPLLLRLRRKLLVRRLLSLLHLRLVLAPLALARAIILTPPRRACLAPAARLALVLALLAPVRVLAATVLHVRAAALRVPAANVRVAVLARIQA